MSFRTMFILFSLFVLCNSDLICTSEFWRSYSVICRPTDPTDNVLSSDHPLIVVKPESKVKYLYMKSCKVIHIEDFRALQDFKDLQHLDLSDNALEKLRTDIFKDLVELRYLNLANNEIEWIAHYGSNSLTKLQYLDLSSNRLNQQSGVAILSSITSLHFLDLSNNIKLPSPSKLFQGLNLKHLVLSSSNFTFPDTYTLNMSNLKFLDLSNNVDILESGSLGNTLSNCVKLIHLKMVGIKLSAIEASSIKSLKQIRTLNLSGNLLQKLGYDVFFENSELMDLDLSTNNIEMLPFEIFHKTVELIILNLSNNKLSTVESILFSNLSKLQVLDLSKNRLIELSDRLFTKNDELKCLDLSSNKIDRLPSTIFRFLFELITLNLSNNKLPMLHENSFSGMMGLSELDLSNNRLEELPDKLFVDNHRLISLKLNGNKIKNISPTTFSTNVNIRTLDLSNNLLKSIDFEVIKNIIDLTMLNLSNNLLNDLKKKFLSVESLLELNLSCNQIISLPSDILSRSEDFNEITVFLLGNPWSCGCLNDIIKRKSKVKIDNNNFNDGKYATCIVGSDPLACDDQMSYEYRRYWLAHHEYFPNQCIPKSK